MTNANLHSCTLRGYTGIKGLAVYENLIFNHTHEPPYSPIISPHLKEFTAIDIEEQLATERAKMDAIALRNMYSCPLLYQKYCPTNNLEKLFFEWFEQLRVESICPESMKGSKYNLLIRFQQWTYHFFHSGLLEQQLMLLIFTVGQMVWARINNQTIVELVEGILEETRAGISPLIGKPIAEMKKNCKTQENYAQISRELIDILTVLIQKENAFEDSDNRNKSAKQQDINRWLAFSTEQERQLYNDTIEYTHTNAKNTPTLKSIEYPIFTTEFDTITPINQLVRHKLLLKLQQEQRQQKSTRINTNPNWLTKQLSQAFLSPQNQLHQHHPAGYIDATKLVPIVLSNQQEKSFFDYQLSPHSQGQLTLLIDCSGSMKTHIPWILDWISLLIPCAEKANIKTEILGFTTGTWNGGRATKKWQQQGTPEEPGRLNEISHIIFKEHHHSWRQTQLNLMGLLKADLFKEGIDGEAILWASSRIQKKIQANTAHKNALLVLSDGHPMDSETMLRNRPTFLSDHLNSVLSILQKSPIDIIGVGLNEELPPTFQKQVKFTTEQALTPQTLFPLIKYLSG